LEASKNVTSKFSENSCYISGGMTKRNHYILPLRKAIGASQGELADLLGITRTTLALTESGSRDIPAKARDRYVELEQWVIASEAAPQGSADEATAYTQQTVVKWQRDLKRTPISCRSRKSCCAMRSSGMRMRPPRCSGWRPSLHKTGQSSGGWDGCGGAMKPPCGTMTFMCRWSCGCGWRVIG
jgi:DNA-binding XRE family transcriptional regulator